MHANIIIRDGGINLSLNGDTKELRRGYWEGIKEVKRRGKRYNYILIKT